MAQVASENSTNVRMSILPIVRFAFRALGELAPEAAQKGAARLFFTPFGRAPRIPRVAGLVAQSMILPFEGEGRIHAFGWGTGPVVLLVHGWEGDAAQLSGFVAPLVAEGYRVVAFDMPAHGGSRHGLAPRTNVVQMDAAIHCVIDAVGPIHAVVAHSLGGAASVLALSGGAGGAGGSGETRKIDARKVVLLAPVAEPSHFVRRAAAVVGLPRELRPGMLRHVRAQLGIDDLEALDVRRLAPSMSGELLVMHDPEDDDVPWEHGRGIAEAWPGGRLERAFGLGHAGMLRDRESIARAVAFIDGAPLWRGLL